MPVDKTDCPIDPLDPPGWPACVKPEAGDPLRDPAPGSPGCAGLFPGLITGRLSGRPVWVMPEGAWVMPEGAVPLWVAPGIIPFPSGPDCGRAGDIPAGGMSRGFGSIPGVGREVCDPARGHPVSNSVCPHCTSSPLPKLTRPVAVGTTSAPGNPGSGTDRESAAGLLVRR